MLDRIKTLFTGPWIGELGWEIMCWQGFLRKAAPKYDRVVVACRIGHDALYADFADDILHFDEGDNQTDMCYDRSVDRKQIANFRSYIEDFAPNAEWTKPNAFPGRWWDSQHWSIRQSFVRLGRKVDSCPMPDILLHIRNTNKCGTEFRNWPEGHAKIVSESFIRAGYSVACIGKSESSLHVGGADCRDIDLVALTNLMASSKLIIGPQSGPAHLATLCGLPQLCWQTCRDHSLRLQIHWNPFNTRVETMQSPGDSYWKRKKMWLPNTSVIIDKAKCMLENGLC